MTLHEVIVFHDFVRKNIRGQPYDFSKIFWNFSKKIIRGDPYVSDHFVFGGLGPQGVFHVWFESTSQQFLFASFKIYIKKFVQRYYCAMNTNLKLFFHEKICKKNRKIDFKILTINYIYSFLFTNFFSKK
jgi:hypothetical protein